MSKFEKKKLEHLGKSFMKIRMSRGPGMEPWETQDLNERSGEFRPFND